MGRGLQYQESNNYKPIKQNLLDMNEFNFRVANAAPRASGFEIGQNVGDTKTTCVTFTTLQENTDSAAFFKEGQTPQSGSTGTAYFNFYVLDDTSVHKYKKSEGIRVNLRDGNTEIAYPGDRISAYRFTNQAWQLRSTFILPSSDQSITL